jgi:predicted ATPase
MAARAGVQTLVESHSDHFLNGLRVAVKRNVLPAADVRIHYFDRGNGAAAGVTSPTVGADGMLSEWPEGFFDEWDRALAALLG